MKQLIDVPRGSPACEKSDKHSHLSGRVSLQIEEQKQIGVITFLCRYITFVLCTNCNLFRCRRATIRNLRIRLIAKHKRINRCSLARFAESLYYSQIKQIHNETYEITLSYIRI